MVYTVTFREQLKRMRTNTGSRIHGNGSRVGTFAMPDEHSYLLPNGDGAATRHEPHHHDPKGFWSHVFLDPKTTPGLDSPKPWIRWPVHVFNVIKVVLLSNYVNVLLVFVPLGFVAGILEWSAGAIFTLNFLAIIPLASILSFATEEISVRLGETLGGLLNATFGNAVELIVTIIALQNDQIEVVKSSMLGSILSNLLLVMGMCFFLGGVFNMGESGAGTEQVFASGTAQTACSLMTLSSASMVIPAALAMVMENGKNRQSAKESILILSRGTAIILLLLYVLYLFFQLRTHKNLFNPEQPTDSGEAAQNGEEEEEEEEESTTMSAWSAAAVLVGVTLIISFCADYLVDSIDDIVATGKISKNFIGLILIPIVGNAAEHVTACVVAIRDKMDLAMGVAVGSSVQIALLVTPFLVLLGWAMGKDMDLQFETFETVVFFISVLVVTYVVQDGKSNYLEGAMLFGLYVIIAVAFYATPSDAFGNTVNGVLALVRLR